MGEWNRANFLEAPVKVIDGDRGVNYPKKTDVLPEGYCLFLNAGNVTSTGFNFSDCSFVSLDRDMALGKGRLERNDSVLTTRGTVGNVAFFDTSVPFDLIRINSGMVIFRPDEDHLLPSFLYQFLRSNLFGDQVKALTTGSAQPQLPIRDINRIEIPLPPLPEQRAIAAVLCALDDKIELNRRMNATLEALARALFADWFVDFGPTRAKMALSANGAKNTQTSTDPYLAPEIWSLFPDRLDENGVPEGWEMVAFENIAETKQGKYIPKEKMRETSSGEYIFPVWGGNGIRGYSSEAMYADAVVLLTCRGSNCGLVKLSTTPSWVSNISFACKPKFGSVNFLYVYFSNVSFDGSISGSAQPQITYTNIRNRQMDYPVCRKLCDVYSSIIDPFFDRIVANELESRTLAQTRDLLLPRLMSGELRVREAEKLVEDCA